MAGKRKVNPSRIPAALAPEEADRIRAQAARDMAVRVRAAFLGAIMDYKATTGESMRRFLEQAESAVEEDTSALAPVLAEIQKISGVALSCHPVEEFVVHTKKDLERFQRFAEENAMGASFAALLEPADGLLGAEYTPDILRKAYWICKEIADGQISLADVRWALETEYGLTLDINGERVHLRPMEAAAV